MLGDLTMEKKVNGRSSSVNPKGNGTETSNKGKQDVNKYQRLSRNKESPLFRSEPSRKPASQKNRSVSDKRPRTRTSNVFDKYRSEVADTGNSRTDIALKKGSKKVNLNHLLNFTLAPHENAGSSVRHSRQKFPKYNKEQFLQANCQFIVQDSGNYAIHAADPDVLVDWHLVEEVHLPTSETAVCPICLYPLVAAKITRCGHLFCWSCILHYLSLTDKSWQKCPICFEAVHKEDLKSVVPTTKPVYQVGEEITMCLMKREKRSLFSLPASRKNSALKPFYMNEDSTTECFQKLLLATTYQVHGIIKRERSELEEQLLTEGERPEVCFIKSALKLLDQREEKLLQDQALKEAKDNTKFKEQCHYKDNSLCMLKHSQNKLIHSLCECCQNFPTPMLCEGFASKEDQVHNYNSFHLIENKERSGAIQPEDLHIGDLHIQEEDEHSNENYCYFYQASDGQHIYLHTLNVHMLVREYGRLEHCPLSFTAKIVELDGISMTEGLRKRLRYLQHLPLTCEFQVAELQLVAPLISESTIEAFADEVDKRKHLRVKKAREEKRREHFIKMEENKKLGRYPCATFSLDSLHHFPSYNPTIDNTIGPSLLGSSENLDQNNEKLAEEQSAWFAASANPASFAQMLRNGKAKHPGMTVTKIIEDTNQDLSPVYDVQANAESDAEDCIPAPEFHQSFSDAIQKAFDNLTSDAGKQGTSVKKKKRPKTLLFTTSMNRSK